MDKLTFTKQNESYRKRKLVAIGISQYDALRDIAEETNISLMEVTNRCIDFAIERIQIEEED